MTKAPSQLELDTLLFVNCARLAHNMPLLSSLPAGLQVEGQSPVDRALAAVVPMVEAHAGPGHRWYLEAPKGAASRMQPIARVWQTSVQHPHGTQIVKVKCPNRVAKFCEAFYAGKMPHLLA